MTPTLLGTLGLLLSLNGVPTAQAGALQVLPGVSILGNESIGLRPGLRVGYEPMPSLSVDLCSSVGAGLEYDAGAGIEGRHWFGGYPGAGVFLGGRLSAGLAGDQDSAGPWMGLGGAFGVRPLRWLHIEANLGPNMVFDRSESDGIGWRSDLMMGLIFDGSSFRRRGTVRHHPRKPQDPVGEP